MCYIYSLCYNLNKKTFSMGTNNWETLPRGKLNKTSNIQHYVLILHYLNITYSGKIHHIFHFQECLISKIKNRINITVKTNYLFLNSCFLSCCWYSFLRTVKQQRKFVTTASATVNRFAENDMGLWLLGGIVCSYLELLVPMVTKGKSCYVIG
jgi:hypothetical protein